MIYGDLNARLYTRIAGEEQIIGSNVLMHPQINLRTDMNRSLLLQLCTECSLMIANTFTDTSLQDSVTYREIWYDKESEISKSNHEMLDILLLPQSCAHKIQFIQNAKHFALKSHHYMVVNGIETSLMKHKPHEQPPRLDMSFINDSEIRQAFTHTMQEYFVNRHEFWIPALSSADC